MEKERKLELIKRSLALRHKLKVHDSLPPPDTHEEMSVHYWARWELEDELHAIEQLLREAREQSVAEKKELVRKKIPLKKEKSKK